MIISPKWTIIFLLEIAMKIEPIHISKVIEQNFANLMHDFYEMQTEYLASLKIIYDDLDGALFAMVLTN